MSSIKRKQFKPKRILLINESDNCSGKINSIKLLAVPKESDNDKKKVLKLELTNTDMMPLDLRKLSIKNEQQVVEFGVVEEALDLSKKKTNLVSQDTFKQFSDFKTVKTNGYSKDDSEENDSNKPLDLRIPSKVKSERYSTEDSCSRSSSVLSTKPASNELNHSISNLINLKTKIEDQFENIKKLPTQQQQQQQQQTVKVNKKGNNSFKMVRGQDEWMNNSRNNFISEILKCLECSCSFNTLAELSAHMFKTNHFAKFQPSNKLTILSTKRLSTNTTTAPTKGSIIANKKAKKYSENLFLKTTSSNNNNNNNNNNEKSSSTLLCLICHDRFFNGSDLVEHLQNKHTINQICTTCGAYFESFRAYHEHLIKEDYHHQNTQRRRYNFLSSIKQPMTQINNKETTSSSSSSSSSPPSSIKTTTTASVTHQQQSKHHLIDSTSHIIKSNDKHNNNNNNNKKQSNKRSYEENEESNNKSIKRRRNSDEKTKTEQNKQEKSDENTSKTDTSSNNKNPLLALEQFVSNKIEEKEQQIDEKDGIKPPKSQLKDCKLTIKKLPIENPLNLLQKMHSNFSNYIF